MTTEQIEPAPGTGSFTMEGLPEGFTTPWRHPHKLSRCVIDADGNTIATAPEVVMAKFIASIPDMIAEIERLRATNVGQKLHQQACEIVRLRAINAELCEALENFVGYGCDWSDLEETECRDIMNIARATLKAAREGAGAS
jgi:hypothetical protein